MQKKLNSKMGRRARDRLVLRDGTENDLLANHKRLRNQVLLVDDDLKETAQALGDIEGFLVKALSALDRTDISRNELEALASDDSVMRDMEYLGDTLASLKRRLFVIANNL